MKKFFVLTVLFVLPILAYLFFSSGVNHFAKLPVLTENVADLHQFNSLNGKEISLDEKITILSFYGKDIEGMAGNAFNLNEKIYDKNYSFKDFQFVVIAEDGTQVQAQGLLDEIGTTIDTKKWNFAFGTPEEIQNVFQSLGTNFSLDENLATPYAFIVDKNKNLRGRDEKVAPEELYGYDTRSVGVLSNEMTDDVKVILAEYRLALKKYNKQD